MGSCLQGSYAGFPSKPTSLKLNKELRLKQCVVTLRALGNLDRCLGLKRHLCLRVGSPHLFFPKVKSLRVSSFKGSVHNDGSGGGRSEKVSQNSVRLSYVPKESKETVAESSKAHDVPIPHAPGTNGNAAGSAAIHKLFRKWLTMLTSHSSDQLADEIFGGGPPPREISGTENETQLEGESGILKTLWCHYWALDATIKFPPLIFIPLFLAVNVTYGREVSKELMPLWVLGPLLIALYIKMLRGLCSLYVFTFKQTVNVIKNLPVYYMIAYEFVARGKLKEVIATRVWQPVVDIKNLDYKELWRSKLREFQEWLLEKYLDFVESIWPYYCRTIRFLKRANLI
ncbi:hypothetical protein CRG98_041691 [Punica granatum]|uniref:Embryo defective 2759 n=1 Tax=Punica granatum TaxID=22663 RepID=A0A2I0I393_PUNGR|nr:hypothetical protein CRG98_041691 [Punica granatum]